MIGILVGICYISEILHMTRLEWCNNRKLKWGISFPSTAMGSCYSWNDKCFKSPLIEIFERKMKVGEIKSSSFISDLRADRVHQLPKTPVDSEVGPTKLIIAELNRTFFGHFRVSSKCSEIFLDFRNIRSSGTGQTFFGKFSEKLQVQSPQAKIPLDSIPLMEARFGDFTIIQTWIALLCIYIGEMKSSQENVIFGNFFFYLF